MTKIRVLYNRTASSFDVANKEASKMGDKIVNTIYEGEGDLTSLLVDVAWSLLKIINRNKRFILNKHQIEIQIQE